MSFRQAIVAEIPRLRRYARALTGDASRADDLVQDTLERALGKWRLWRPGNLRAWLFTLMHNIFVNQLQESVLVISLDGDTHLDVPVRPRQQDNLELRDLDRALARLSPEEQALVRGFVINRFRGDVSLLTPGLDWLQQRTAKPTLAVLPYLHGLHLDAEDAVDAQQAAAAHGPRLVVAVPVFPRISNHTDFDALRAHPQVDLRFVGPGQPLPACDLIVLPGSKNTLADLRWLREQGHEAAIARHLRYGGKLIGICGGFQMLGRALHDPLGLEGPAGSQAAGLGLLDMTTTLAADKQLRRVQGRLAALGAADDASATVQGYEIHLGISQGPALQQPAAWLLPVGEEALAPRPDGALSADGQVLGSYVHGLFDDPQAQAALLRWAGLRDAAAVDLAALREASLDRLADVLEEHLDVDTLWRGVGPRA